MKSKLFIAALVAAIVGAFAFQAQAKVQSVDGSFTITAASTCATSSVPVSSEGWTVDRIVLFDSGAVTSAVAVAAADCGVFTPVASFALAASGGSNQWPRRQEVASTTTNNYPYVVRDLRLIGYKNTNSDDVVIQYRFYGND